jgi:hypothetical protein
MDAAEAVIPADESTILVDGSTGGPTIQTGGLTGREREILAFEGRWWRLAGKKENAIREAFGLSPTRYYQALNSLLDKQEAIAADPLLVNRLRRARISRRRVHAARHWEFEAR